MAEAAQPSGGGKLAEADLPFLIGLDGLATKWKSVGVHLCIPSSRLDVIQQDNCNHVNVSEDCLRDMFVWWVRNGEVTTAEKLAKAVHEVGCNQAEVEINRKFGAKKAENRSDGIFHCPCGQCSLDQYLDEGCLKSNSQQFPYLDVANFDEDDREDLTQKLLQDNSNMIKHFAKLVNEIRESLVMRNISVETLTARVLSLGAYYDAYAMPKPLLSADIEKLQEAKTVCKVFIIIQPYMSFFNHELLKHITDCEKLCIDHDREQMEEYRTKFNDFCRRRTFEVPPGAVGLSIVTARKSKRKIFAVLITKQEGEQTLVFVNEAKHKLASILKLRSSTLHLHRIDEGSIILVFSIPEFVANEIFPLKSFTKVKLKMQGFRIIIPVTIRNPMIGSTEESTRLRDDTDTTSTFVYTGHVEIMSTGSTEDSTRADADTTFGVLLRNNHEVFFRGLGPDSTESRSVLPVAQSVCTKRKRKESLTLDSATLSFSSTCEGGSVNEEFVRAARYTKTDSDGQPYHWRVDIESNRLQLCLGNVRRPGDNLLSYFKYMPDPRSQGGRLTVLNGSYTIALNTKTLESLVVLATEDKPTKKDYSTDVHRYYSAPTDMYVFYYECNKKFYPIRPDFDNRTLIVKEVDDTLSLRNDPQNQWTKVPEPV